MCEQGTKEVVRPVNIVLFDLHRLLQEVSPNCNDDVNRQFKPKNKFYPLYLDIEGTVCPHVPQGPKKGDLRVDCNEMGKLFGYIYIGPSIEKRARCLSWLDLRIPKC